MKTPLGIPPTPSIDSPHTELRTLIAASRQRLAGTVNAELTRLYWAVGERLRREVLGGERAAYGCAETSHEQVELLRMQQDGITVADRTELPPKEELERLLHQALIEAWERLTARRVLMAPGSGVDEVGEGEG